MHPDGARLSSLLKGVHLGCVYTFAILYHHTVTHLVDSDLLLTSKQKFRFGLARSGQARPIRNFCFDVNGRFESTRCVYPVHVPHTKTEFLLLCQREVGIT